MTRQYYPTRAAAIAVADTAYPARRRVVIWCAGRHAGRYSVVDDAPIYTGYTVVYCNWERL